MPPSREFLVILRTLVIGLAGAMVFQYFNMPAAFMSGALVAVAASAVAGVKVAMPNGVRNIAFYCAGLFFGTTVNQDTVNSLTAWPFSIAALAVSLIAIMTLLPRYLERVHGYDRETAGLSAVPGALSFVLVLALERGADIRRITIVQTSRLAILIVLLPIAFSFTSEIRPLGTNAEDAMELSQALWLYGIAALGIPAAFVLRIPAPFFSGPFFLVGALFGAGVYEGALPSFMLWPALAGLGAAIGSRFAGVDMSMLREGALAGLGSTSIGLAIAAGLALPVAHWLGLPFLQLWLAFAPGGIDALTVVAFSLGADPAFVAGHQMLRFIGLSLLLPFAAKWFGLDAPRA
ncbi:MAG: AbrB family transcriptional regulator [Pseudomonadota bacterium]